jgi:hypothetical protein
MQSEVTAGDWLTLTVGALFVIAGLSFVHDKTQRYVGIGSAYGGVSTTQVQIGADDIDKELYAGHVLTAGLGDCGCPACCKG